MRARKEIAPAVPLTMLKMHAASHITWVCRFMCSTVVFDTLTERGENVDELITTKMDQSEGITYGEASREVVAEAMTDILPDANFVEELATNHKTVFNKLHEKLKEFVSELKAYFNSL